MSKAKYGFITSWLEDQTTTLDEEGSLVVLGKLRSRKLFQQLCLDIGLTSQHGPHQRTIYPVKPC